VLGIALVTDAAVRFCHDSLLSDDGGHRVQPGRTDQA
jgi:hypothetical protein